jgi:UDP-N-acetylmuramoyl-tripeptide--D-alanyl-D-alanine ligase
MIAVASAGRIAIGDLVAWVGGELRLPPGGSLQGLEVRGASIDSRTLAPGNLFVPLPGERADGHAFLEAAFARGAAAALALREPADARRGREPGPLVVVDDVTAAFQRAARAHRGRWPGLLIGITGSAGKTTTKELVAAALGADRPTLKTEGNLNNHWGVPLTLLALSEEHGAAVVEMGMSAPGEIALLADLARPDAAVITLVGPAHLESFADVAAIAHEKTALARALPAGAPVFAGADSPPLLTALRGAPQRVITYGLAEHADVRPRRLESRGEDGWTLEVDGFPPCRLPLVGRHQAVNALAAFAVAREYALDPAAVVRALEAKRPVAGRMETRRARGGLLLLDQYNANPDSMRAALDTLAGWPHATRRIAVLGEMLELGAASGALHAEVGAHVRDAELWAVGPRGADYAAGAASGVIVRTFATPAEAGSALREALGEGVVVLLKASRGARLERVLEPLERD